LRRTIGFLKERLVAGLDFCLALVEWLVLCLASVIREFLGVADHLQEVGDAVRQILAVNLRAVEPQLRFAIDVLDLLLGFLEKLERRIVPANYRLRIVGLVKQRHVALPLA
jgi:hypothetical protein